MDHQDIVEELSRLADQNARIADQNARLEVELSRLRHERIPAVDRSSRRRDRRLTLAYVLVTAVVVGFTAVGSASALDGSNTVFSDDIVDGTVTSLDVAKNSLITSDIKDNSIASRDVADGTLNSADVANAGLTGEDINLTNDNQCNGETVWGTAVVNADAAVPDTFTTDWVGWQHSCSGQPVRVRRTGFGTYDLDFGSPARLAVVSPNDYGQDIIGVRNTGPGQFHVTVTTYRFDIGAPQSADHDFSILTY
jgi:hypothetical protein